MRVTFAVKWDTTQHSTRCDVSGELRMRTRYRTALSARMTAPRALSPAAGSRERLRWATPRRGGSAYRQPADGSPVLWEAQQETGLRGKNMSEYGITINESPFETKVFRKRFTNMTNFTVRTF